ncbi:hypothetical protein UB23_02545 [Pseudomonas sp. ES3-33]|nr:hypothetical protein UB23_02545 [Pseudomonas sp. ES3-33]
MPRLGRMVALAGKNGSGKSRILRKLSEYVTHRVQHFGETDKIRESIEANLRAAAQNQQDGESDFLRTAKILQTRLDLATERVISNSKVNFKPVKFVPKHIGLSDPRQQNPAEVEIHYFEAKTPGIDGHQSFCVPYLHYVQHKWWNATHPSQKCSAEEKEFAIDDYETLKKLVLKFLNTELSLNLAGNPTLYGKPIPDAGLSDGQIVLLQLCVAIHAQNKDLDDSIFILDEPENHLHPSAVIDVLQSIYDLAPNSQIWVATHSVPLLAYMASVDTMSIWYVDDGAVANSGRYPERVLKTLLGDQERLDQLNQFTGLPSQLALITYAAESLLPPQTLTYGEKDPQISQIRRFIVQKSDGKPISILDIGAGKGRLLAGLAAELVDQKTSVPDAIDYFAFDPFPDDKATCEGVINSFYPNTNKRYFNSRDEFFSNKEDGSVSIAVLCNVLHEIPPKDWAGLFSENELINRSLSEDGYLMIVEDQRIPVGEMAHALGFLVLNTAHLRTLFSVTDHDVREGKFLVDDARGNGRLLAHFISKSLLSRVSAATVKRAIEQLLLTAKSEIKRLRAAPPSYSNGQLHGFWTQQFANAALYLDET